ncbi:Protein ACS-11 [Aphelenchoides avenae]|nr:Protein ACS-11 [Aphelenchus avenae]
MTDFWRFTKDDVQFHQLPFYHVHGMLISFGCTLASKSSLVFRPKFDVDDAIKWLPKSTVMMGVPTYYSRLLHSEKFTRDVVKNIRVFIAGSAPLGPVLFEEFRQRTGQTILERYGMTESAGIITSNPYEEEKRVAGSVGIPIPGTKVRISKDSVIEVKGPGIFKGYWKLPEKTKQEFTSDGYFITGDLGDMDASGTVRLLGRGKDLIITGGLNVYPAEVEDVVHASEHVKEVAIIGVPHEDFGEAVVAVCIPSSSGTKLSDEEYQRAVLDEAKEKLAGYKRPKKVIRVEDFPRNFIGKVKKNELRDIYKKLFAM